MSAQAEHAILIGAFAAAIATVAFAGFLWWSFTTPQTLLYECPGFTPMTLHTTRESINILRDEKGRRITPPPNCKVTEQ